MPKPRPHIAESRQALNKVHAELKSLVRYLERVLAGLPEPSRPQTSVTRLELVKSILAHHPEGLDIRSIVTEMTKAGYIFIGNPIRSTRAALYGRPDIQVERGRFRLRPAGNRQNGSLNE